MRSYYWAEAEQELSTIRELEREIENTRVKLYSFHEAVVGSVMKFQKWLSIFKLMHPPRCTLLLVIVYKQVLERLRGPFKETDSLIALPYYILLSHYTFGLVTKKLNLNKSIPTT